MITNELLSFIKNEIKLGKTQEQIKSELLSSGGWSSVDIEEAFKSIDNPTLIVTPIPSKIKSLNRYFIFLIIFLFIGVFSSAAYFLNKEGFVKIPFLTSIQETKEAVNPLVTELDIYASIPDQLKIISEEGDSVILEGDYKGLKYTIAIGENLYPPGECYLGDDGAYYNSTNNKSGEGWFSITPDEHKSGNFNKYNCYPEEKVENYIIPIISSEHQDLYGDGGGPVHYMRKQTTLIMMSAIKNNFYSQIYNKLNPKYSLEELDKYGNMLEVVFSTSCLMPLYNNQNILSTGPNSDGCSPSYWQDSTQNSELAGIDPVNINYATRKALLELLSNKGCPKNYVAKYLEDLSIQKIQFSQDDFSKKLSCAGNVTVAQGDFYSPRGAREIELKESVKKSTNNTTTNTPSITTAQCLKDKGALFYGAFWCPHCNDQKELFKNTADDLPYIECSTPDGNAQTQICIKEGITGYPFWTFADGTSFAGMKSVVQLAEKTNCPIYISN